MPRLYFDPLTGAFKKIIMSDNEALEKCTSHMPQKPFRMKTVRQPFVMPNAVRFGAGVPWLTGLSVSPYYDWDRRDSAVANEDQANNNDDADIQTVIHYSAEKEVYEREIDFAFAVPQIHLDMQAAVPYPSEENVFGWLVDSASAYGDQHDTVGSDLRVGDSAAMKKCNLRRKKKCWNLNFRFRSSESVGNSHPVLEGSLGTQPPAAEYSSEEAINQWLFDSARACVDQASPDSHEALSGKEAVVENRHIRFKASGFGVERVV